VIDFYLKSYLALDPIDRYIEEAQAIAQNSRHPTQIKLKLGICGRFGANSRAVVPAAIDCSFQLPATAISGRETARSTNLLYSTLDVENSYHFLQAYLRGCEGAQFAELSRRKQDLPLSL